MKYYIWTIGCQMNREESLHYSRNLQLLGLGKAVTARDADIVVLNTCVVRQNAEKKVLGMLGYLKGIKREHPSLLIAVTGCFVESDIKRLHNEYPFINCFFGPSQIQDFQDWLFSEDIGKQRKQTGEDICLSVPVSSSVTIIQGCNNYCSYCIVPYRRGRERSRQPYDILAQANDLVKAGAREIVLLGQNVNTYGSDISSEYDLAGLLYSINNIPELQRIRFLTNHPKDMSDKLINAIASLSKVCHHLCLPLQSGDDDVLKAMNRHYKASDYAGLVTSIKKAIPDIALSTDVIVGFPGETENQFLNTYQMLQTIKFDTVHAAAYSPRKGTAAEKLPDNVPENEKVTRLQKIEKLQMGIALEKNNDLVGKVMVVLVEGKKGNKWYGRTYSDKLVFFLNGADCTGKLIEIHIESATAWALQGTPVH